MATNICHWLKVHSRWFKNYICVRKSILISFWSFKYCLYYSFTHYYCAIFYSLDAGFFHTIWVSNSLDPDQARHFVGPDLGPNCLQGLSADIKMSGWIWVKMKLAPTKLRNLPDDNCLVQALIFVQAFVFDLAQLTCQKRFDCRNAILWSSAILLGTSYS